MKESANKITIIYPGDPLGPMIGGGKTFINSFIKYAPIDFVVDYVGVSSDLKKRPVRKWSKLKIGDREFNFFPVLFEKDSNKKTKIPLTFRYTLALRLSKLKFDDCVFFFNRIEPAIILRKIKTPKVGVMHNDLNIFLDRKKSEVVWSKIPWFYYMFENYIYSYFDVVYSVNKKVHEFYLEKYSKKEIKFMFLPTCVDPAIFYPDNFKKKEIRQKILSKYRQLSIEKKWILYVGRIHKQKAPLRLIQTFYEYYKFNQESCLLIIGEGELKTELKKKVKNMGLSGSVQFFDFQNQIELSDFYRASDVFLLTSNFEGMPISVLEALGCGIPIVSLDVGEVRRVVKSDFSGEIVKSVDPKKIARNLEKVLENKQIYSSENCVRSIRDYTPDIVFQSVYELMRQLMSEMNH